MKVKIIHEVCCEDCGEINHNHFECPSCLNKEAGTSIYGSLKSFEEDQFFCENCGAKFFILNKSYSDFRIELLKGDNHESIRNFNCRGLRK